MGREIRLRATSYCSRSRFFTQLVRVTFSVVLSNSLNSRSCSLFSGREECLQYAPRRVRHEQNMRGMNNPNINC